MAVLTDPAVVAMGAFLQARINGHGTFAADLRETLCIEDSVCLPVNAVYPCDPFTADGFADAVASGNSAFPILGVWRSEEVWTEWTWEQDKSRSVLNVRWILPADPHAERTTPCLREFVRLVRIYIQALSPNFPVDATSYYHAERAADRAALKAVGVWGLAEDLFRATYAYNGPNNQAAYPTVTLQIDFHCKEQWPANVTAFTSFEGKYDLHGQGQEGDDAPAFNPLVTARTPVSDS